MDEKDLGKRLQLARKRAGLTQQELCHSAGLSYSTLAKIERGAIKSPSVFTVAGIARATGVPLEDLLDLPAQTSGSPAPLEIKKRSKTGVRFVYFDIDGVLLRFMDHAFTEISNDSGMPLQKVENIFWRHNDEVCRGQISETDFNAAVAKEVGLENFDWRRYYLQFTEITPGVLELLDWAAQHYDVGLLSNHMPGLTDELLQKNIIPAHNYKTVLDSYQVKSVKPEAKIFEEARARAGFEPSEILLVDDMRPNLTAADHAGWQIVLFDSLSPEKSIENVKEVLAF
ncbi:HAD-IA family hydrolase [Candidatus Saccharibacteria bacterium]|nr:HAD-IA family hydrolase [Candidatus Saccharibacteria bacterium]